MSYQNLTRAFLPVVLILILSACGGGSGDAPPPPPTATTAAATEISLHTATLNGTVNPHAQATNAWFEWGTDNALVNPTLTTTQAIGSGSADNSVSAPITGLTLGTTYYYRVGATNASGTQKGTIASFTTALPNSPPSVTTNAATSVTISGEVLNGTVGPNELDTTAVFEWGTDSNLTTFTPTSSQSLGAGTTSVAITASLTDLTPGVTYYFRVSAINSAGTQKGLIVSFTADAQPPTVSTNAATSITITGATLNGTVNPNGLAVSDAHFEWGPSPTLATFTSTANQSAGSGFAGQGVTASLTGLAAGTTYYFRVAASNSAGPSNGTILNFTTTAQPPTVATAAADNVSVTGATLHGTVNPNGLAVTDAHFEYGTSPTLATFSTTGVQPLAAGFSAQPITASPSGLTPGMTYYFRVAATNSAGPTKGLILSFSTDAPPPTVVTAAATSITTSGATLNGTVNPNGDATDAWFEYGTDPALSSFAFTTHMPKGSGTATLSFNASISGLSSWTSYYYRAAASNSGGTQKGPILSFPTGEYYVAVGDSITFGSLDDISSDDTSLDGRNTGGGFEPILNDLLSAAKGYPHTVVNKGVSGDTSAVGVGRISNTLSNNPSAKYFLIMYGTNDADNTGGPPVSKNTYMVNMQSIITAIKNAGKIPFLAKVPYVDPTNPLFPSGSSFSDVAIQQYNLAIDELRISNGISVVAPDFYTWFQSHTSQLADGIHPNGTGYQSMANLWFNVLP